MNTNIDDLKNIFQLNVGPKIENLKIFANISFILIKTNFIKKNSLCSNFNETQSLSYTFLGNNCYILFGSSSYTNNHFGSITYIGLMRKKFN